MLLRCWTTPRCP